MKQTLFLTVGFPGAGKTTAARMICEQTGATHIWADDERRKMFKNPVHLPEENRKMYGFLNRKVDMLLAAGKSVVFDSNFNFYKDRENMRKIAASHGAQTVVVWISTPNDRARARATEMSHGQDTRIWGNMPPETFDRMSRNLQPPREDEKVIKLDGTSATGSGFENSLSEILGR